MLNEIAEEDKKDNDRTGVMWIMITSQLAINCRLIIGQTTVTSASSTSG